MKNIFESPDRNLLGVTLVEGFGERLRFYREKVLPDMIRRESEANFMFTEGLYQAKIVNTPGSATVLLKDSLFGVEKLFKGLLLHNASTNKPSILLDLGGMFSLTLSKLAVDSDIQKRILKGSIVLVSHNFSLDNSNILNVAQDQDIGSDKISLLKESMGLVHRIQSNIRDIHRIQIPLPNRRSILIQNIHILHEHLSLGTHGYTPETDFARISNLLDYQRGTAFLDSQYEPEHHRGTDAYNESDESWTQRYKGVMISRKYFTQQGLTQMNFENYLSPKFVRRLKKFWRHRYDYPFSDAYRYQVFSANKSHIDEVIQSDTYEIVSDER